MKMKGTIQKRFIAAESDALVIETIETESKTHRQQLRVLRLKGTWHANDYNEIVFEAALRKGPPQTYTFKGSWKLNNNQQIEYTSDDGRDKLVLKGYWQLPSTDRLVYILEGSQTCRFEFKVHLESHSLHPKSGQIRYRIGIGTRRIRKERLIILHGEWKFGRNLGLIFQMDYGNGQVREIEFGAEVTWKRSKLILTLNKDKKPLGLTLNFTHKMLSSLEPEVFLRLKSRQKQLGIEAGFSIPF